MKPSLALVGPRLGTGHGSTEVELKILVLVFGSSAFGPETSMLAPCFTEVEPRPRCKARSMEARLETR